MFAREGTHGGSVYRRSDATSQVLFPLERSLTYHCASHLRLAESWMPFRLPAVGSALSSFPRAARGYLLSPLSFSHLHTLFVLSLVLFPKSFLITPLVACGWGAVVLESVCRNPAGTTHVVRPCFQGPQADVCTLSLVSCSVAVFCRRGHLVCKANLLSAVSRHDVLRLLQLSLHVLTRCLVVSGHHSTNPALY